MTTEKERLYFKRWAQTHRESNRAACKRWAAKHRVERLAYAKRLRLAHPERYKAYAKRSYLKHRERVLSIVRAKRRANPQKAAEINKRWIKKHPAKVLAALRRRTAQKMHAVPAWFELKEIRALYKDARLKKLHVDHIVPLNSKFVCGLHCLANLQLLSKSENSRKSNRVWPDQWA